MEFSCELDPSSIERLERAVAQRSKQIANRLATLAVANVKSDAGNRTPGTSYSADVSQVGSSVFRVTVEADPRSEGADINLKIALGGRKAYTIRPKRGRRSRSGNRPGVLAWDGDDGRAYARQVSKPAIAPINGGDFIRKAVKRAVQRIKNDYS